LDLSVNSLHIIEKIGFIFSRYVSNERGVIHQLPHIVTKNVSFLG